MSFLDNIVLFLLILFLVLMPGLLALLYILLDMSLK